VFLIKRRLKMSKIIQLSKEELEPIVNARSKSIDATNVAEKAIKDARLAELEFKVAVQQLYLEKGLNLNCNIDITNGSVTWPCEEMLQQAETRSASDSDNKQVSELLAEADADDDAERPKKGKKAVAA
jgi:hypothetical protein